MRGWLFLLCLPLSALWADSEHSTTFALVQDADWQLGRRRSYILGKILSYRLNAYDDYSIAELILDYVDHGATPIRKDAVGERAYQYIADLGSRDDPEMTQLLLVRAYTMRWLNGYADLMWARFLEKLHILRPRIAGYQYGEREHGRIELFFWRYILKANIEPIVSFIEIRLPFTLTIEQVADQILLIQHGNTEANLETRAAVLGEASEESPVNRKAFFLREIAETMRRPDSFLRGAARGQVGAGRWDSIFSGMIRRRLGSSQEN